MKCAEFQQVLPEIIEGGSSAEQEQHLRSCSACSSLVSDLNTIAREAQQLRASEEPSPRVWQSIQAGIAAVQSDLDGIAYAARDLQASEEPSPRVWNSLEIALRREGLIRQPRTDPLPIAARRWRFPWLLPIGAAAVMAFALLVFQRASDINQATVAKPPVFQTDRQVSVMDDQQLLDEIGNRSPALRATYQKNLQTVDDDIQDAEQSAQANPNDEEVQQYLIDAYDQKAMVYQLAMDRSLP